MRRAASRVFFSETIVMVSLFLFLIVNQSEAAPVPLASTIVDARVETAESYVRVDIIADGRIENAEQFSLSSPTRLVVDLPNLAAALPEKQKSCDSALLRKVRFGEHPGYIRCVLESPQAELGFYDIVYHAQGISIFLGSGFEEASSGLKSSLPEGSSAAIEATPVAQAADEAGKMDGAVAAAGKMDASAATTHDNLQTTAAESLEDYVESADPAPETLSQPDNNAGGFDEPVAEKHHAEKLPEIQAPTAPEAVALQPAEDMNLAMAAVNPVAHSTVADTAPAFAGSKVDPVAATPEAVTQKPVSEPAEGAVESDAASRSGSAASEGGQQFEEPPKYTGEHISLDFKDADIKNILRLIAEVSDLNVVAGDDVEGTVTIRLTDVPWDQALEVILLSNELGMDLQGNILRVAPLDALNREREKSLEARKKAEVMEPLRKGLVPVSYANVSELRSVITSSKLLTSRGSIQFDKRTNTMVIIDIEKSIREVQRLIHELDTPTPQVLIESRIIQINPTYVRELGVSWDAAYTTTSNGSIIGIGGADGVTIDGDTGEVTSNGSIIDLAPGVGPGVGGGISFGLLNDNFALFARIAALEKDEKLEIISSPRIMTLDNQEAIIEQGVDIPYLKLSEEGVSSTEFKKATLALTVTPHITADGSVQMEVEVKKDQRSAQTGADGAPGIDTRRAETNVLVRSGDTVVIGGIYEDTKSDSHNSVPFFGRLPLLGFMFKATSRRHEKTELIVFISPTIITIEKTPLEEAVWLSNAD